MRKNNAAAAISNRPADAFLQRLDGVRETGPSRWLARCPSHEDKHASLSIRETGDGKLLIHCFAMCSALEVVESLGLSLSDLFPDDEPYSPPLRHGSRRMPAVDALIAIDHEALVVSVIASDMRQKKSVDEDVFSRLALAASRIGAARDLVTGGAR